MAVQKGDLLYAGKAKSVFRTEKEGIYLVEFRDDITAFDGGKKDVLVQKGSLNARVSAFLFGHLEEHGISSHFIGMVDERSMLVRSLAMIPL